MVSLQTVLPELAERHYQALEWFQDNVGREVAWSEKLPDGTSLVTQQGIYKPRWTPYVLTIGLSLSRPYEDGASVSRSRRFLVSPLFPGKR